MADLCTLADVREVLELPAADTSRDTLIASLIDVVSAHIQREYAREFTPTSSATRTFQFDPGRLGRHGVIVDLAPYDLRTATTVTLHPEATSPSVLTANTHYRLPTYLYNQDAVYPFLWLSTSLSFGSSLHQQFGVCQLSIAGAWGFAATPDQVVQAAAETVAATMRRDLPNLGLDLEVNRDLQPVLPSEVTIPGRARRWLASYRRHSGVF